MQDAENPFRRQKKDEEELDLEPDYQPVNWKKLLFSWKSLRAYPPLASRPLPRCLLLTLHVLADLIPPVSSSLACGHRRRRPRYSDIRGQEPDRCGAYLRAEPYHEGPS